MSAQSLVCPKCHGHMVQGFVADFTHGGVLLSTWYQGPPQASWWRGTKVPQEHIPIGTFRCDACGFLESYARSEFDKQ